MNKLSRNEKIIIVVIDFLLLLSVFLPLANVRFAVYDNVGPTGEFVYRYISCINFMESGFIYLLPYIVPLFIFLSSSLFIKSHKVIKTINFISLIILSIIGIITLMIFNSIRSLYCIVFILSVLVIIRISYNKKEVY